MENDRTVPWWETSDATRARIRIVNYTDIDEQSIEHFLSERFQWQIFVEEGDYDVLVQVQKGTLFDPTLATSEDKLNILLYSGPPVNEDATPGNWTRLHFHEDGNILDDYVINYTLQDVDHIRRMRPDLFQNAEISNERRRSTEVQPRQAWSTEIRPAPALGRIDENSFTRPRPRNTLIEDSLPRFDDDY